MRPRTIAIAAITVDGKIARGNHELVRWTSKEDKAFFRSETARIGVMILGNSTYETFPAPLPDRLHIVMTRSLEGKKPIKGHVEFTNKSPKDILEELGDRGFKEVVIAGGSRVYTQFVQDKLLDELWLTIEPQAFGEGVGVFSASVACMLHLKKESLLNPDSVLLQYEVRYQ